jgi:opacity protein-like surface antigen
LKKILAALLLTLPTMAMAIDLDGYYITPKVGVSKTMDTGTTTTITAVGETRPLEDEDLSTGTAFGLSLGKYLTNNFRLELEVMKRTGFEFDTHIVPPLNTLSKKADIDTKSIFINGFYDFNSFDISSTSVTPYLGGGVGFSRNKLGTTVIHNNGATNGRTIDGESVTQFAYKLSAGTLVSLTEQLSLDVNYQYVNLGGFKSTNRLYVDGVPATDLQKGINGGDIKTQELMVGLQYTFK